MKALITGASSGLGWDMAHELSKRGYDIIAVARREERLKALKEELNTDVTIVCCDVSDIAQCRELAKYASEVDILINNAGFGVFGDFLETDLDKELKMLDTNTRAMHILTKLYLEEFVKRDSGKILNVASIAAFFPGPRFSAYYATKAYVLRLSQSIAEELRRKKSKVRISVLCPGPVKTEFEHVASVSFGSDDEPLKNAIVLNSKDVAHFAIKKFLSGKLVIIPGTLMKIGAGLRHILPDKFLAKVLYIIQSKKIK
ncbi:MAG: SDR family oxidoreductase [Clostridia bacterium]|nr:SDR family oxidoreductase [Clostridia bacterium]